LTLDPVNRGEPLVESIDDDKRGDNLFPNIDNLGERATVPPDSRGERGANNDVRGEAVGLAPDCRGEALGEKLWRGEVDDPRGEPLTVRGMAIGWTEEPRLALRRADSHSCDSWVVSPQKMRFSPFREVISKYTIPRPRKEQVVASTSPSFFPYPNNQLLSFLFFFFLFSFPFFFFLLFFFFFFC
jgi:hypothetical protein